MIKFFRKIRRRLLTENNFSKYLLYGIGEIILVVIGILIALALNNLNELRKNELKVDAIFEDILLELSSDVEKTTNLMRFYEKKDSIIYVVLNDSLTFEDYENNKIPNLFNLTTSYEKVSLTQDAYNNLIQNLDAIPLQYKSVLNDLSLLYNGYKNTVDDFNDKMELFVEENVDIRVHNYPWFSERDSTDVKSQIEFLLDDFRYRNEVSRFYNLGIQNHLKSTINYRLKAVECYQKIAALLNKPIIDDPFRFDSELVNIIVGAWETEQAPGYIVTVYMDDNRCFHKNNANSLIGEFFNISKTKMVDNSYNFFTLIKEGDEYISKTNGLYFRKVKK